mmetsp:Transcript_124146/g.356621  ORF Transcript_124146/g.356621 Transcript_124146/m.356621 type:complete len:216 (-) Transcript_124146:853-1500(-)
MAQQIAMQIGPEDSERRAWINKSGHGQRIKIARACRQSTPAVQHGRDRSGSRACLLPGLTSRVTQGGKQAREKRSMHPAGCHSAPARPCAWQGRWEGFLRRPPQAEAAETTSEPSARLWAQAAAQLATESSRCRKHLRSLSPPATYPGHLLRRFPRAPGAASRRRHPTSPSARNHVPQRAGARIPPHRNAKGTFPPSVAKPKYNPRGTHGHKGEQ